MESLFRSALKLGALCCLLFALSAESTPALASHAKKTSRRRTVARMITPGKSVGEIKLGSNGDSPPKSLGASINSEGAAGHIWETFKWNRGALDLYSVLASDGPHRVRQIRTTSSLMHAKGGVAAGKPLSLIRKQFPHLTRIATYTSSRFKKRTVLYDDVKHGIAFEVTRGKGRRVSSANRCLSILVHAPGKRADQQVLSPVNYPPKQ